MNFLAGRVAASEGAYFTETSKHAIARLREKATAKKSTSSSSKTSATPSPSSSSSIREEEANADVLPEILRHSLPRGPCFQEDLLHYSLPSSFAPSPSSLAASLSSPAPPPRLPPHAYHVNLDTTGLFAFLPNLPQASFGPRRWKIVEEEVKKVASTANEARMEGIPTVDESRAKALIDGYVVVMKAFFIATSIVAGGSSILSGLGLSMSETHSMEDIRTKVQEHIQPWAKDMERKCEPWKQWVQEQRKRWHWGDNQINAVGSPFAEVLGLRSTPTKEDG